MYKGRALSRAEMALFQHIYDSLSYVEKLILQIEPNRERSIALTRLEEAALYANVAIARAEPKEPSKEQLELFKKILSKIDIDNETEGE